MNISFLQNIIHKNAACFVFSSRFNYLYVDPEQVLSKHKTSSSNDKILIGIQINCCFKTICINELKKYWLTYIVGWFYINFRFRWRVCGIIKGDRFLDFGLRTTIFGCSLSILYIDWPVKLTMFHPQNLSMSSDI